MAMPRSARHPGRTAALGAILVLLGLPPAYGGEPVRGYELTIRNTNAGQNFSPPVLVLHAPAYRLFELGQPATAPLWRLAEDGATAEFRALAGQDGAVRAVLVGEGLHRRRSPVFTTRFEAAQGLRLSVAAMLSLTNDAFVAADSIPLPEDVDASMTVGLRAYDAGSEANTELCAHVPCEVHGRRMVEGAEGVVTQHPGLRGDADIATGRGWQGPELGSITITRIR